MNILMISNSSKGFYNFKKEIIEEFINPNTYLNNNKLGKNNVTVCVPDSEENQKFYDLGCKVINVELDRRGTNILKDSKLLKNYINIIKKLKPDLVMTFTIKPNIYGGIACQLTRTKYISSITGLGTAIRGESKIAPLIRALYRNSVKKAKCIYFENKGDLKYFNANIFKNNISKLVPGSGINLNKFKFKEYPDNNKEINFLTIGRIMKDKGSSELLEASKFIKSKYKNVEFYIAGDFDDDSYKDLILKLDNQGIINYLGFRNDISYLMEKSHCIIHPSYHEGLSNVLLEAAATGRPVIASDVPGCKETFIEGETGISIKSKDISSLIKGIERFLSLENLDREKMGIKARKHVEKNFNRKFVIKKYINELESIENEE